MFAIMFSLDLQAALDQRDESLLLALAVVIPLLALAALGA